MAQQRTESLPDPRATRRDRNRAIALEVLRRGDKRGDRAAVARDMGIETYEVSRALAAEKDWAASELEKQKSPKH